MPRRIVTHYAVFHTVGGTTEIVLYYHGGGAESLDGLSVAEAGFMVDILRNEKPISYETERKILSTYSLEPVGEGE